MSKKLAAAVIDSSSRLCVALGEPAAKFFLDGFSRTEKLYIGAATRAETWLAVHNAMGSRSCRLNATLAHYFLPGTSFF